MFSSYCRISLIPRLKLLEKNAIILFLILKLLQEANYEEELSLMKSQVSQTQRHQVTENITTIRLQRENKIKVDIMSPNFHIHVSVSDFYIPRIGPHISCSRIGRLILEIYKSLTDI